MHRTLSLGTTLTLLLALHVCDASLYALPQAPPPGQDAPEQPRRGGDRPRRRAEPPRTPAAPPIEPGVKVRTPAAQAGYTLYAPISSTDTYLVDLDGTRVHTWPSKYTPGHSVYLLEDGSILRTCKEPESHGFQGGGQGGRIQKIAWDGTIEWDYLLASDACLQHHDIELMPNGNILAIVWERVRSEEAHTHGVPDARLGTGEFWPDAVYEIRPDGPRGGEIIWRWRSLDHVVQDLDPEQPNFGKPAEHPGRIDVGQGSARRGGDWLHTNAIAYNPDLDQIALSIHGTSELWIIDHGLTTEEAAGPAGDLLYRWGNPATYGLGTQADQQLHLQHDVQWIPQGFPGAGDLLMFDNQASGLRRGRGRGGRARGDSSDSYSAVLQITPPLQPDGTYARPEGERFGPATPTMRIDGNHPERRFFSQNISGAQRLPNGNTLICSGAEGRFIEVTPDGTVCWEFVPPPTPSTGGRARPGNPEGAPGGRPAEGGPGRAAPPGGGGRGGPPGGGRNNVFRCTRVLPSNPAIVRHQAELTASGKPASPPPAQQN